MTRTSSLIAFLLLGFIACSVTADDSLKFLLNVRTKNESYSLGHTDMYRTWGGEISSLTNDSMVATLWDSDGDVFFEVRNGERFCVVDAQYNLTNDDPVAVVYFQQGCWCALKAWPETNFTVWNITVEDSETDDCQWDGTKCAPLYPGEQMTVNISLTTDAGFTLNNASQGTYGGDVNYLTQNDAIMSLWDSDGDVYFNITALDGSGYCDLDFGANMYNWAPLLNVMRMRNVFCTVTETGYHHFEVSAVSRPGWACDWNGYQWACLPVNSTDNATATTESDDDDDVEVVVKPVESQRSPSIAAAVKRQCEAKYAKAPHFARKSQCQAPKTACRTQSGSYVCCYPGDFCVNGACTC